MVCKYTSVVFCHKRSVSFVKESQLTKVAPPSDPIPAFADISGWTIDCTVETAAGLVVLNMSTSNVNPEIIVTDGINNLLTTTIPNDVMMLFPLGKLRFDFLFYDMSGQRRASQTAYFEIEEEVTVPRVLP